LLWLQVQRKSRPGEEMGFEAGSISKETAEMRADLGKQANFWDMQVRRAAWLVHIRRSVQVTICLASVHCLAA
jgi:hypothetical protein